jgi:hypothetical protein
MAPGAFAEVARTADLFLNVSGAGLVPDELSPRCVKVFVDTDPGYNQIVLSERFAWSENVERWCASVYAHDRHFTYAENIHGADCRVPRLGLRWRTTRVPIHLDAWAAGPPPPDAPWTTVMTWNAFKGPLVYEGVEYTSKGTEFEKILALPGCVDVPLVVAVGGIGAPRERLAAAGWRVADAPAATATPEQYRKFVAASRAELSPAKQVYAAMRTGWFSCRSACYLAAGRPVVVQDTGFTAAIPAGAGVLAFSSLGEAAAGVRAVEADYARHARAARELAAEHFDAGRVLTALIEDAAAPA